MLWIFSNYKLFTSLIFLLNYNWKHTWSHWLIIIKKFQILLKVYNNKFNYLWSLSYLFSLNFLFLRIFPPSSCLLNFRLTMKYLNSSTYLHFNSMVMAGANFVCLCYYQHTLVATFISISANRLFISIHIPIHFNSIGLGTSIYAH